MVKFNLTAELHECEGTNEQLVTLVRSLFPFTFSLTCKSPSNNYQLLSDFDSAFSSNALSKGWTQTTLNTPDNFRREHDGCFATDDERIVVEIEKANWAKFLYDLLKCHVYVSSGATGCLILLPINWPHSNGTKNIYHDCIPRLRVAQDYGAIRSDVADSLVVVGFRQMYKNALFDMNARLSMREECQRRLGT